MESDAIHFAKLIDLILDTKDGDWGKEGQTEDNLPYLIIRGTDFDDAYSGRISRIPVRFLEPTSAKRRTLLVNDILIETAGGTKEKCTGKVTLITDRLANSCTLPITCASFARFIRIDENKANPQYVFWFLRNMYELGGMWEHQVQHTGIARFQFTRFSQSQDILLHSLPHQKAIAHILGTLDDKIELLRQINETLEAMARALFKSWFVDFDPVRKKAAGLPTGLPPEVDALFPDCFEDSELGEIPKGWSIKPLDLSAEFLNGIAAQKYPPTPNESVIPVIKIAQLRAGSVEGADLASSKVPEEYIVKNGDILFSWSGSLMMDIWTGGTGLLNQHLFKVSPKNHENWFVYHWVDHYMEEFQSIAQDKATTMGHIQRRHLSERFSIIPTLEIEDWMNSTITPIFTAKIKNAIQITELEMIRNTLLPKLISGDLEVKDIDKILEHAK